MAKYNFTLTENICLTLEKEGLFFAPHLVGRVIDFTERSRFYRSLVKCGWIGLEGAFSYTNSHLGMIPLGNYSSIAVNFRVFGTTHPYERFTTSVLTYQRHKFAPNDTIEIVKNPHEYRDRKMRIGNDVWVGDYATFAPDVHLHTGCVVASTALVVKDVPPYAIVGGNPAKIIKYRFEDKIIEQLLETRWTEYDISPMKMKADIEVEKFIDIFYDYRDKGLLKPIILKNLKEVLDKHGISYEQW